MLNPVLSNFQVQFNDNFFPQEITKKYDDYLKHLNHPFKTMYSSLHESIQSIQIGGISLQPHIVEGIDNTGIDPRNPSYNKPYGFPHVTNGIAYEGNQSWWNSLENTTFTVTFRNNIINWMYCYEFAYKHYLREKCAPLFRFTLKMMDSAEVEMIRLIYNQCFIINLPGLEFAYNQSFNESKSYDVSIQANKIDVDFNIPEFEKINIKL